MLFSDYFGVEKTIIDEYGAVDISLFADTPLFIDPLLIYNNEEQEIKKAYSLISDYLLFLNKIVSENLTKEEIGYYFKFKEVKENWLGLCTSGNQGNALGDSFANELFESIKTICDNRGISSDVHIEKMYLVKRGVGKDRISDWVANVLLSFFVDYTSKFAQQYIDKDKCKVFEVKKYSFDYEGKRFIHKMVSLPCLKKNGKEQYVLLTPKSILRRDEQEISYDNFQSDFGVIRTTLPNDELRCEINTLYNEERKKLYDRKYYDQAVVSQSDLASFEKDFMELVIEKYPEIYDYFIRSKEKDSKAASERAKEEVESILQIINNNLLLNSDAFGFSSQKEHMTSFDEALFRINYLKDQIEINGLWKNLYYDNRPIAHEDYLQRLFALEWCRSHYRFSPESNSGVGPVDFLISYGFKNATVVEFKLASNPRLSHVFKQVDNYQSSHRTAGKSIIVVFYFSSKEKEKVDNVFAGADESKYEIIFIDCDCTNKKSASIC